MNDMSITLSLTHDCNLRCSYCYAGRKSHRAMTRATMQRALEWAVGYHKAHALGRNFVLGFFGGEPLLEWDLLREADALAERLCREAGLELRRTLTTNGTLLDEEKARWLTERHYTIGLSLDGPPERHDRFRRHADGSGSYAEAVRAVRLLSPYREPCPEFNCVVRPDSLESVPEAVRHLAALAGFPIALNPDFTAAWKPSDREPFRRAYGEVADFCVSEWREGRPLHVTWIDAKLKTLLMDGYREQDRCCPVRRELAAAPSGNLYPCPNLVGEDDRADLRLGDVFSGIDAEALRKALSRCGSSLPACKSCPVAPRCQNWCGCANWFSTGRTDAVSPFQCFYEKTTIELADRVAETLLAEKCEPFLAHFGEFIRVAAPEVAAEVSGAARSPSASLPQPQPRGSRADAADAAPAT
ncbi:MAG: radical SAM protein [Kiritimatiellae bacterium]|nr:radical SAM protein [Kiritimatiellia bacterium]